MNKILKNFIVIEGIDGSGKTTQIQAITQKLTAMGKNVCGTREPHNGIIGTMIRDILNNRIYEMKSPYDNSFSTNMLAYLFASDRYEHVYAKDGVLSQLAQHDIVICDRYLFSSLAYQGEQETQALTKKLNENFPLPQLLIYLDISPEESLIRMKDKQKDGLETLKNLRAVHSRYAEILLAYSSLIQEMHVLHIDATIEQKDITDYIVATISSLE